MKKKKLIIAGVVVFILAIIVVVALSKNHVSRCVFYLYLIIDRLIVENLYRFGKYHFFSRGIIRIQFISLFRVNLRLPGWQYRGELIPVRSQLANRWPGLYQ